MLKHPIPVRDFVDSLPLFEGLDSGALSRLTKQITALDISKGSVFVRRGDACLGVHIVVYGHVKLSLQAPKGDEKVVELLGRGQSFGEAPMFLNEPYRFTAECLVDSKLLHLPKNAVLAELECDPVFARRIISSLSERLGRLINDLEGCTLHSGTQRVVTYLLSQLGNDTTNGNAIRFPARKSVIASHLNLTHEHFSRILHELISAGVIEVRGPVVHILDAVQLRQRAA